MSERLIQTIKDIADAIREKSGTNKKIKGSDIPQAIRDIAAAAPAPSGVYYNTVNNSGVPTDVTIYGTMDDTSFKNTSIVRLQDIKRIPKQAFSYSSGCSQVYLDDNVEEFGTNAFYDCAVKELIFPDGTKNRIPASVTVIPDYCFYCKTYRNGNFTNIELHDNITKIGRSAFDNYGSTSDLLAIKKLPENLEYIGQQAFNYIQIPITEIPAKVKTIGGSAFWCNLLLTELTFKGTPTTIENGAFGGCSNLKTINVPWAEGAVSGAPWGATAATINYNYVGG